MKKIAVLPGDGIGPEVMEQACRVLKACENLGEDVPEFELEYGLIGGAAYEQHEAHFPVETHKICERSDAILFGSVGGPVAEADKPKWHKCEANSLLSLRKAFSFNANLRPVQVYPELNHISPLKAELIEKGIDMLIVRELTGGIYFGEHRRFEKEGKRFGSDICEYDEDTVRAIAHVAFQAAEKRDRRVTSADKANVLDSSRLWREIVSEVSAEYPAVTLEHMLVDNCAMQIIRNPSQFDVLVTTNMFGDILSDAAAVLPGSLGLMASASLNASGFGMYEPSGGSAPDIAGQGIANPIAQILSVALMLKHSFGLMDASDKISAAVTRTLQSGFRTGDISQPDDKVLGTAEMTDQILKELSEG